MSDSQASKAEQGMGKYFFRASAADFTKIPGEPIAYWLGKKTLSLFDSHLPLAAVTNPRVGLLTSDNEKFLRYFWEVGFVKCCLSAKTDKEAAESKRRWFPHNKGGGFRKWAGNYELLVDWENYGERIKKTVLEKYPYLNGNPNFVVHDEGFYFRPCITWSEIGTGPLSFRMLPSGFTSNIKGMCSYEVEGATLHQLLLLCNGNIVTHLAKALNPTVGFGINNFKSIPAALPSAERAEKSGAELVSTSVRDWDAYETSWNFTTLPLLSPDHRQPTLKASYQKLRAHWRKITLEMQHLEEENNDLFIEAYDLQSELTSEVPLNEITLTCNPHYRYGGSRSEEELETLLQCDTLRELVSYAIGCMMGRYSLDKPGLILASQGETLQDYLRQIPSPRFAPDDDAILPLTDQEWFADDATNRFREFIRVVWGEEHLQQNLDFVAESLCLHAIKPKKGEASLDTIRRYLSSQFFKDHLRTYKKRPIYWLFSSGKHKAFECLVYLHRYNEGTLARMRTEYVIPLTAKLSTYAAKLEKDVEASTSTAEKKSLEKELTTLHNQQAELATFDEKLRHHADQRISLDLDDGVKVNYGKFGDLLAEVKAVTGDKAE